MKDRETAQEKLEYEIFSEQCFEQEKKEKEKKKIHCEGIDCAWCGEKEPCIYKIANELEEKFLRKTQECEELKKTIMYKCPQCGDEYLSPIGASLYEKNNKLKQTLTEIKEIVGIGLVDGLQPEEYSGFLKTLQAQILQKISEVEND